MTPLRKYNFTMLGLILVFVCFAWVSPAGEQKDLSSRSQGERQYIELLKKQLDFNQWISRDRNGLNILLPSINFAPLLPVDIEYTQEKDDGNIPAYWVRCARNASDGTRKTIAFKVWLFPSVYRAREGVLRRFMYVNAPMSYQKKRWEKENVTYGDKSFGFDCWITGNLVFDLKDGYEYQDLTKEIFSSIDNMLNSVPTHISGTATDIGIKIAETGFESWTLAIPKTEAGHQVVILYENANAERLNENAVRVNRIRKDQKLTLHFNVIEAGKLIHSFRSEIVQGNSGVP